jgi:diamine N-acetyltransferase
MLPINETTERRWIESLYAHGSRNRVDFAIVEREQRVFIGLIGASDVNHHHQRARLGVMLKRQYQGRGYASDATRTFLEYLFRQLNMARVELEVLSENERAFALYKRLGFVAEGTLRQHYFQDGCFKDVCMMGLLRSDYDAAAVQVGTK